MSGAHTTVVERDLPGAPAEVFDWFVDPALLVRWWPSEATADPVVGGSYRLVWSGPGVVLTGNYEAVVPGERLAFTWSWEHEDLPARLVDIGLVASGGGTALTVTHEAGSAEEADGYRSGWEHFLGQLAAAIESSRDG